MSQHIINDDRLNLTWKFGWDNPLQSFFLQKHDHKVAADINPVLWLGATAETRMYDVADLVRTAMRNGLDIPYRIQVELHEEQDNGR